MKGKMMISPEKQKKIDKYLKVIKYLLVGVLVALGLLVAYKYLLPILYPFVIAYIVALILQPIVNFLNRKAHVPKKLSILILVLAVVFLLGFLIYKIGDRVYYELKVLTNNIKAFADEMNSDSNKLDSFIEKVASAIPFVDVRDNLRTALLNLDDAIKNALTGLASKIADFETLIPAITKVAAFVPKMFIDTIIIIISAFYFASDFKKINSFIALQMPENVRSFGRIVKKELTSTTGKYIRAYSLIILITFAELFVGFTVLDIRYAFVLALVTSLIDILPVLGTGTVIIPWALYSLITGDYFLGVGLLVLYIIITVIRQIMEPKIVGTYIGLYPLVTLMCMYAGLKLLGLFGMFLFPITAIILKNLNENGIIKLWKNPAPAASEGGSTVQEFMAKSDEKDSSKKQNGKSRKDDCKSEQTNNKK